MNYNNFKSVNNKLFLTEQSTDSTASSEHSLDHICYFNENCTACAPAASNVNACARVYARGIYFDLRGDRCRLPFQVSCFFQFLHEISRV